MQQLHSSRVHENKMRSRVGRGSFSLLSNGGGDSRGGVGEQRRCWVVAGGGGGLGERGEALALLVLGVGLALDEHDAPALHHLAVRAQPLHRRANLHLLLPPPVASSSSDSIRATKRAIYSGSSARVWFPAALMGRLW